MFQQLLANKRNRLRDSRLSLVLPSGDLRQVADKQDLSILKPRFYKHDEAGLERI